jgi:periplasmic protein TonB
MILPDYRHKLNDAETLRGISPASMKKNFKSDLRRQYHQVIHYSFILTLLFIIINFRFFPVILVESVDLLAVQEIIDVEQIDITRQEERPPPPQRPPVVVETHSETLIDDLDLAWGELNLLDDAPALRPLVDEDEDADQYFMAVEEMPRVIGGIASIMRHVRYPEVARRAGVEGTVFVLAYIDEEGVVQKVELLKGIGAGLDEEAMQAVSKVRFTPGKQRGIPRKVRVAIPVIFTLRD